MRLLLLLLLSYTGFAQPTLYKIFGAAKDKGTPAANHLFEQNGVGSVSAFGSYAARFIAANTEALIVPSNNTLRTRNVTGYGIPSTSLTVFGWVRFVSLTGNPQLFINKDDNTLQEGCDWLCGLYPPYEGFVFQIESSEDEWTHPMYGPVPNTTRYIVYPVEPELDTWYFVVGWYDKVRKSVNIQVDNGFVYTQHFSENTMNSTNTAVVLGGVGSDEGDISEPGSSLNGDLKSWSLFKRVLTAEERTYLYNSGTPLEYDDLTDEFKRESHRTFISWWDLKEISGTRYDSRVTIEP